VGAGGKSKRKKKEKEEKKAVIGVLASRDDPAMNRTLVALLRNLASSRNCELLEKYHFVFTGGTYDRVFNGDPANNIAALEPKLADWYHDSCGVSSLTESGQGGVTLLTYMITQRECSILWPFFAPKEFHWLRPENLALMRLCDQWHVKRLMNRGSVLVWFDFEAEGDAQRNRWISPPEIVLFSDDEEHTVTKPCGGPSRKRKPYVKKAGRFADDWVPEKKHFSDMTIALIAHDEMKSRMVDFAVDHESELNKFRRILATGTTGREVAAATSKSISKKLLRAHSGPKGGDIEIATAVLYDECDIVIFFIDPLSPHPHVEDIRVVFEACMIKDKVVMITNAMHAREFMTRVVRPRDSLTLYAWPGGGTSAAARS